MEPMKKVEVVVDSVYLNRVLDILERQGVSGYTVIRDVLGKGERGIMAGDELTDVFKNSYVFTVCSEEIAKSIAESLRGKEVSLPEGEVCGRRPRPIRKGDRHRP